MTAHTLCCRKARKSFVEEQGHVSTIVLENTNFGPNYRNAIPSKRNFIFLISRLVLQKRIYIVMMMMLSYEAAMETCVFLPLISLSPKFCFLLFISYP